MTINRIESLPLFDVDENFEAQPDFYFSLYHGDRSVHMNLSKGEDDLKWEKNNAPIPLDFKLAGKVNLPISNLRNCLSI